MSYTRQMLLIITLFIIKYYCYEFIDDNNFAVHSKTSIKKCVTRDKDGSIRINFYLI